MIKIDVYNLFYIPIQPLGEFLTDVIIFNYHKDKKTCSQGLFEGCINWLGYDKIIVNQVSQKQGGRDAHSIKEEKSGQLFT